MRRGAESREKQYKDARKCLIGEELIKCWVRSQKNSARTISPDEARRKGQYLITIKVIGRRRKRP